MSFNTNDKQIFMSYQNENLIPKIVVRVVVVTVTLCEMCPNTELFLVSIFLYPD